MNTIFDSCNARSEVLKGEVREEIFACLKDGMDVEADRVYPDLVTFFENAYLIGGLKLFLDEAPGRLTGKNPTNNTIIRLETAFGGGKTHNLIALYHAANGHVSVDMLHNMVALGVLPQPGRVRVAGVVGSGLDPTASLHHLEDNVRTYIYLVGGSVYQLAGVSAHKPAAEGDRHRAVPGTGLFKELIGNRPTLIMLDGIARHMCVAQTVSVATGKSDLGEKAVAFLMSLLEFAVSRAGHRCRLAPGRCWQCLFQRADAIARTTARRRTRGAAGLRR